MCVFHDFLTSYCELKCNNVTIFVYTVFCEYFNYIILFIILYHILYVFKQNIKILKYIYIVIQFVHYKNIIHSYIFIRYLYSFMLFLNKVYRYKKYI